MKTNCTFLFRSMSLISVVLACSLVSLAQGDGFNRPGNILISDQFNNRVIEVNPETHRIVWTFGNGSSVAGLASVVAPNDAQRVGPLTLIAGTGAPGGSEPSCTNPCQDNRVMLVDPAGQIIWQYGQTGVPGSGPNQLNTPVQNTWIPLTKGGPAGAFIPAGDILVTDQVNERIIEITLEKKIVWQYGMTGTAGCGFNQLNSPNSAELLPNGHILIADENNNRVIEVTRGKQIVWSYGSCTGTELNTVAFASRLPNGDTLITDSGNNRVIEVDSPGSIVWSYVTDARAGSVSNPNPTRAVRLRNGNTLISDQFNDQVIEVDVAGNIVFSQGTIAVSGNTFDLLNAPYDAKVNGDYTGLTPPF
jgi:hypothetical protein